MTDSWSDRLDDLSARRSVRHRDEVRRRIAALVADFTEIGALGGAGDSTAFVCGIGRVDGRLVAIGAEDFSVAGGSIGVGEAAKRQRIAELALQERIPLVMLLEGAGHRPPDPDAAVAARSPGDLMATADASGRVPIAAAILGPSAGHGALAVPLADYSVMSADASIFAAGPPLVRAALGEDVTKDELGGPQVAIASGLVHDVADDVDAAIGRLRKWLSYLPSSAWHPAAVIDPADPLSVDLTSVVPVDGRSSYDMRDVIDAIADGNSWFEIQHGFGASMLTGWARIAGAPVAVVANQPAHMAGTITADAAGKAAHFVSVADAFHIPLVFLTDNPGVMAGTASERSGILRHAARLFATQHAATVPKVQVTLRKAFGFGSTVMAMNPFDHQTLNLAWPGVTLGAMPARGGDDAIGANDERAAAMRAAELDSSYRSARNLSVDDVIDPNDTRRRLELAIELASSRQLDRQPKRPTALSR